MPDPEAPDDDPPRDRADARHPGRSGGIITLERADEVMVVGDLHGNIPAFKKVLTLAALDRNPGRHLVLQELIHGPLDLPGRQGGPLAPAPGRGRGAQVPVSRSGPPDPGQSRAFRADRPVIGKDGEDPQRQVSHGDRDGLRRVGRRDLRGLQGASSPRCRWRSARPIASSSATRSPTTSDLDSLDLDLLKADTWPEEAMKRRGTIYALTWGRDTSPRPPTASPRWSTPTSSSPAISPATKGSARPTIARSSSTAPIPIPAIACSPPNQPVTIESLLNCVHLIDVRPAAIGRFRRVADRSLLESTAGSG